MKRGKVDRSHGINYRSFDFVRPFYLVQTSAPRDSIANVLFLQTKHARYTYSHLSGDWSYRSSLFSHYLVETRPYRLYTMTSETYFRFSFIIIIIIYPVFSFLFFFFSKVWNRLESNEDDSKESLSKRNRGISILINSVEGEDGIILSRWYLAGCHEAFDTKATDVSDVKVFHTHRRIQ